MSHALFRQFRTEHPRFVYESFTAEETPEAVHLQYTYTLEGQTEDIPLIHRVTLERGAGFALPLAHPAVQTAIFNLGMVECINYWKLACPPTLLVCCGRVAEADRWFWEKLYIKGLGEFYYLNGIFGREEESSFVRIVYEPEAPLFSVAEAATEGCLIPVGGGKDSVVTMELLRDMPGTKETFLLSARKASYDTAKAAGYGPERQVVMKRSFDPALMAMNSRGYLNGHVPYSAILAFSAELAALLRGRRFVVLSNEGSANEPTVAGTWVNHQYSKTMEFEADFIRYAESAITPSVHYFSLLRPWSEARIAEAFAGMTAYHGLFLSCNKGSKQNLWCCACPKCLFVFVMLAAYAGVPHTAGIFGKNLLENPALEKTFDELAGLAQTKPFECVGTVTETVACMDRISAQYPDKAPDVLLPALVAHFRKVRPTMDVTPLLRTEPELAYLIPAEFRPLVLQGNDD